MADLYFFCDKFVDVAGKALKEKDIIFCEKFIAEHSTWPRRKLVRSGLGIPQQTARRAIDINIVVFIITPTQLLKNKKSNLSKVFVSPLLPHSSSLLSWSVYEAIENAHVQKKTAAAVSTFAPKVKQIQIHINLILILFKNVKKNIATGKMSQVITSLTIIVNYSCYHFFDFELTWDNESARTYFLWDFHNSDIWVKNGSKMKAKDHRNMKRKVKISSITGVGISDDGLT